MKITTTDSPKFRALCVRLAIPSYQAIGILESLWIFAKKNAPQGNIGKWSNLDIAAAIEWSGDPDALVAALVECRWIDPCLDHRLVLHDWAEHAEAWLKNTLKAKNLKIFSARIVESSNAQVETECLPNGAPVTTTRQDKPSLAKPSQAKTSPPALPDSAFIFSREDMLDALVALHVAEKEARELSDEFEPGEIYRQIQWLPHRANGKKLKNPAGMLVRAIRERFDPPKGAE